ncbi:MAG: YifB family Mg chelatase-like AAA ATPase [Myxococcales bacterium]|nr:YifB family Mg chelatase-like AAA ATPase [Myxococcota bacterium]MDW8281669.1 YifB family Mg chelatase-like AAA ATPase [Myxococcales bacterium]
MLARVFSAGVLGIEAYTVEVEADVGLGLPAYHLVGLPDNAVKEGSVRVRAALENAGFPLPPRRYTINLAPADVRKDGAAFDLPSALALLTALGVLPPEATEGIMWLGELGLDGSVRPVLGSLPVALHARRAGFRGLVLPAGCAPEASCVRGLPVFPVRNLGELVAELRQGRSLPALEQSRATQPAGVVLDLRDVRGQEYPKRALEIAAAGGHNLLLLGPPGTGKSMLARRLPGILPPLSEAEAIETTAIYSAAGLLRGGGLLGERPFRAPHHDVSVAGLVGGGPYPRPGEISLAHHGVLFLDELPEFQRPALEALRQPLEDRRITIVRARCAVTYPASFALCAAMNPCPCGYRGSSARACTCDVGRVARYLARLSGPLLDRFDLHVEVPTMDPALLLSSERAGEASEVVRQRVMAARARQQARQQRDPGLPSANADLGPEAVWRLCRPGPAGERLLAAYLRRHRLSSRALHRVLRVARTLADLAQKEQVGEAEVAEAIGLRALDRPLPDVPAAWSGRHLRPPPRIPAGKEEP